MRMRGFLYLQASFGYVCMFAHLCTCLTVVSGQAFRVALSHSVSSNNNEELRFLLGEGGQLRRKVKMAALHDSDNMVKYIILFLLRHCFMRTLGLTFVFIAFIQVV